MSSSGKSLADHPVIVLAGLFLAVLGGLAAVDEMNGSNGSSPPSTSQQQPPSVPDEAPSRSGTSTAGQPSPPAEKTSTAPAEEQSAPAERTEPPSATAEHQPGNDPKPQPRGHKGALTVRIEMGRTGQVGPNEWRAGVRPGANTVVYDVTGQLDTRCYVQWTLKRDHEVVQLHRSGRCRPPSITLFNFDEQLEIGTYTLAADVTTDWGQTGSKTIQFEVSPS